MSTYQHDLPPIDLKPIISYPREAQMGQTYLMSIDVQLASPEAPWPYPEEEYPIFFMLDTYPYFSHEPLDGRRPAVVLHRFGGTYGPARYLLTATREAIEPGKIYITLINGGGLPIGHIELLCEVKQTIQSGRERKIKRLAHRKPAPTPAIPEPPQPITLSGHRNIVWSCAVSPDGRFIISASVDRTLKVWDFVSGRQLMTLAGHTDSVEYCAISSDGRFIISASADRTLKIWDFASGRQLMTLAGHTDVVEYCAISPDGRFIVSASADRTLKIWDFASGRQLFTLRGHASSVYSCAVTPDSHFIVSASWDNTLKIWDASTGVEVSTLSGHGSAVWRCVVSSDGHFIVSASADRTLKVWDFASRRELFTLSGHTDKVHGCAISADDRFIVSASDDGTLKVWETASGAERFTLTGHTEAVYGCAVSPDGHFIVSASWDCTLKVWDVAERVQNFARVPPIVPSLIARQLVQAGWTIQDSKDITPVQPLHNLAIKGHMSIPDGYILFLNGGPVGAIRVKSSEEAVLGNEEPILRSQIPSLFSSYSPEPGVYGSAIYGSSTYGGPNSYSSLPFVYDSTGIETSFTNYLEPEPRSRSVFNFHRPETFAHWLRQAPAGTPNDLNDLLRSRLRRMPPVEEAGLYSRDALRAVAELEKSLRENRPRALIQMPDGSGKTPALAYVAYRLLRFANARRILLFVNSDDYAQTVYDTLKQIRIRDTGIDFTELFSVQILRHTTTDLTTSSHEARIINPGTIDPNAHICITTIEQFYLTLLRVPDTMIGLTATPKTSVIPYNSSIPIEFFDVILINNCAPRVYREWCHILEYFDAFIIGATNTADKQIRGFFNGNLVYDFDGAKERTSSVMVQQIWNYCNILRDDGMSYDDYIEQLTYLLFLKMTDERAKPPYNRKSNIPADCEWQSLLDKTGTELEIHYNKVLSNLGSARGIIGTIFRNAFNKIQDPTKLRNLIVDLIDKENWTSLAPDVIGGVYEGLLQKNAEDTKSGAGQYFTPRALTQAIVEVMQPQIGQTICDPACGTGGFLLAAHEYMKNQGALSLKETAELRNSTFSGWEIVDNIVRLCAMNLFLHGINPDDGSCPIIVKDSLIFPPEKRFDIVLSNPPFGRKRSMGSRNFIERADFIARTSSTQLNFVQHIKSLLKVDGHAAIVLPDNVLFEGGAGEKIRADLLTTCDVHTLLRLPTGIFYAQGIKANVIFFDRKEDHANPWTRELWVYDFRTNQNFTRRTNPLTRELLEDFVRCYNPQNRFQRAETEHFRKFSYEELSRRDKTSLDIFWLRDGNLASTRLSDETIHRHFSNWLTNQQQTRTQPFTDEQILWLERIRARIASSGQFTEQDFERSPFTFDGGLVAARHLFGNELPTILQELNRLLGQEA